MDAETPLLGLQGHGGGAHKRNLSTGSAIYSLVNIFIGLGLLSAPFCAKLGGPIGASVILTAVCISGSATAYMLARCFDNTPPSAQSYTALGRSVLKHPVGFYLVFVPLTLEFVGAFIINILFIYENFLDLLPAFGVKQVDGFELPVGIVIALAVLVLGNQIRFSGFELVSAFGVLTNFLVVTFAICEAIWSSGAAAGEPLLESPSPRSRSSEWYPVLSIYMLALAGHGAVPGVYREMKRPQDLGKVIGTSFVIMWCVYLAFTLTCYSIYGDQVEINIMNNFRKAPSLASAIVQALVLLKCFASIPGISCVLFESFKSDVKSRTVVILFIIGVSTLLRSELELVEVVTGGGCTVLTSYVFPVAFMIVIQATLRVRKRLCTEQQSAATTGTEPANEDEEIVDVTADDDDATV